MECTTGIGLREDSRNRLSEGRFGRFTHLYPVFLVRRWAEILDEWATIETQGVLR
jgi:hypothetical protein